jgi:hypothetical protein
VCIGTTTKGGVLGVLLEGGKEGDPMPTVGRGSLLLEIFCFIFDQVCEGGVFLIVWGIICKQWREK